MPAPYAALPDHSRGRLHPEPESPTRSVYQRDRDRIIHSGAFRKLKYKTQVFVYHVGDYYRTRLSHSIEVAQIARSVSRALDLNEDLAEALALAHDLGHTPFGHAGEDALDHALRPYGGFQHNDQTLRILTRLERRYAGFDGLNLTWETLEGVVKHNGPLRRDGAAPLPCTIAEFDRLWPLDLHSYPGVEAQIAAISDDIAYNNHDIDDGLRARLITLDDLADLPCVGEILAGLRRDHPGLERRRLVHEMIRRLIDRMVTDLLEETRRRIGDLAPRNADDIRAAPGPVVAFSDAMTACDRTLRDFLFANVYRHYQVNRETSKARRVVRELFDLFVAEPNTLPTEWQQEAMACDEAGRVRVVADYIAGMTDRYALVEHQRLFDVQPKM